MKAILYQHKKYKNSFYHYCPQALVFTSYYISYLDDYYCCGYKFCNFKFPKFLTLGLYFNPYSVIEHTAANLEEIFEVDIND